MILDTLDYSRRETILQNLKDESKATRGFYFLLILSVIIATFGLVINSSASIIGGMLVAPFLFPILATGGAIISGDENLFKKSVVTIVLSTLVAVTTAAVLTWASPLTEITSEILARTKPTLIDLIIALASGAAGAYAYAKKETLAALPGVAIAAALVPPLGVMGFAIGSGRFNLVGDASLLYLANLLAIIIASVITFYLMGFTPGRKKEKKEAARREFIISAVLFVSVMAILSLFLIDTINDARETKQVETSVQTFLKHYKDTQILQVEIEDTATDKEVRLTLRGPSEFTPVALQNLEDELREKLGGVVDLKVIQIRAVRLRAKR